MKIICIGRNYVDHIKELDNNDNIPKEPIFFTKPDTALLRNNEAFYIPSFSNDLHYETELVVKINRVVKAIDERFASRCYDEVGLGIDFTARDIQRNCIENGLPWEICKAFDHSAAITPKFIQLSELDKNVQDLKFEMKLNGEVKQSGNCSDMIFTVDKIIAYVSTFMTLKIGDLIFTGTPVGVGAVKGGDYISASLEGVEMLNFDIK